MNAEVGDSLGLLEHFFILEVVSELYFLLEEIYLQVDVGEQILLTRIVVQHVVTKLKSVWDDCNRHANEEPKEDNRAN